MEHVTPANQASQETDTIYSTRGDEMVWISCELNRILASYSEYIMIVVLYYSYHLLKYFICWIAFKNLSDFKIGIEKLPFLGFATLLFMCYQKSREMDICIHGHRKKYGFVGFLSNFYSIEFYAQKIYRKLYIL